MITKSLKYLIVLSLITFSILLNTSFSEESDNSDNQQGANEQNVILFDGIGTVDLYGDSLIKIDGKEFLMAGGYSLREFGKDTAIHDSLREGLLIGYHLNEEKKINAVWIIKKQDKDKAVLMLEEYKAKSNM